MYFLHIDASVGVLWSYRKLKNPKKATDLGWATTTVHIPTPGIDPGSQLWQASSITTALSRPLIYIPTHVRISCLHFHIKIFFTEMVPYLFVRGSMLFRACIVPT